jgi:hypothetical protein
MLGARALLLLGRLIPLTVCAAVAPALATGPDAGAPPPSQETAVDRLIRNRAIEAVIWGMPAVNYDRMLQEMLSKTRARENEVVFWSRPVDWKNQTLTPNPDAIYLMTFINTKDVGPVVVEVPPADGGSLAGNIVTVWQMPLEDAGPAGADQGKGGKYLFLPPGYSKKVPAGYIPLASDTFAGYALLRSNLASHSDADLAKSVAFGKRIKVYPLGQAAHPPPTKFSDAADILFDSTIQYDLRFFRALDRIVQSEPWIQRDRVMIDLLRSIGIEKGKPFIPDARMQGLLTSGIAEARALLEQRYDKGLIPFFPGTHWASPAVPALVEAMQSGFANPDSYPVDARGLTYTFGYIGIKRLGTAQFYLLSIKDKAGQDFDGAHSYRLHVPPNAPVKQYWSLTAYDRATHALIKNMSPASRSSQTTQKNADGSVDVYIAPKAPAGTESNWVPTDPAGKFEFLFRLYGPEKALFDRTWKLPDVERID